MDKKGYTIAISIDEDSGGFYIYRSPNTYRICLGHIAITFIGLRFDTLLKNHLNVIKEQRK